jgi:hypothetical protein
MAQLAGENPRSVRVSVWWDDLVAFNCRIANGEGACVSIGVVLKIG